MTSVDARAGQGPRPTPPQRDVLNRESNTAATTLPKTDQDTRRHGWVKPALATTAALAAGVVAVACGVPGSLGEAAYNRINPQGTDATPTTNNETGKDSIIIIENPHFVTDIQKAMAMNPQQLEALQVPVITRGKHYNPEDVLAGSDESGFVNRYRGMIVSATIMDETSTVSGHAETTKKGVVAMLFEVNGQPMMGYYVADPSKLTRIGIDLEQYTDSAFSLQNSTGNTAFALRTPTEAFIQAIGQSALPDSPIKPSYDHDGIGQLGYRAGSIVDIATTNIQLADFLDAVAGPTGTKTVDLQTAYNQQKAQLPGDKVMPPFTFKGATLRDIQNALVNAPVDNNEWRFISLHDAVTDFQAVSNYFNLGVMKPITINGTQSQAGIDYGFLRDPNDISA